MNEDKTMKWPQDFDGKHAVAGGDVAAEHSGVDALEIYEFAYKKYGQHIVAIRTNGAGRELFDAVSLFSANNSLKEYERVKDEAAQFAKKFVAQFNRPYLHPTPSQVSEKELERVIQSMHQHYNPGAPDFDTKAALAALQKGGA